MKLLSVEKACSPDCEGYVRISALVSKQNGKHLTFWFDIPSELEGEISDSGNPWVVCMLLHALENGEDVELNLPLDAFLNENLKGLMMEWIQWFPHLKPVKITAPIVSCRPDVEAPWRTGAFFSGGLDSWFTAIRHSPDKCVQAVGQVDDLINVHGFDIPLSSFGELDAMTKTLRTAAAAMQRTLVVVRTNLRSTGGLWGEAWGAISHAAGLSAVGLVLEKRFGKILIGSAHSYGNLIPWGSHPMTDPLFSTSGLAIAHDGAMYTRVEKTKLVSSYDFAIENLHVCWFGGTASNCGECPKCLRTMVALELFGVPPGRMPSRVPFDIERAKKTYLGSWSEESFFVELRDAASAVGDSRIRSAMRYAIWKSRLLRPLRKLGERAAKLPGLRRFGGAIFRRLKTI